MKKREVRGEHSEPFVLTSVPLEDLWEGLRTTQTEVVWEEWLQLSRWKGKGTEVGVRWGILRPQFSPLRRS